MDGKMPCNLKTVMCMWMYQPTLGTLISFYCLSDRVCTIELGVQSLHNQTCSRPPLPLLPYSPGSFFLPYLSLWEAFPIAPTLRILPLI